MKASLFLAFFLFGLSGSAQELRPQVVPISLTASYIPQGFDSNDNAELVIEGALSNTCYKVGPQDVRVDKKAGVIKIRQMAYKYAGICLEMLVPFHQVVNLGILDSKTEYQVVDGVGGQTLGTLPIRPATSASADDYLYAHVSEAVVTHRTDGSSTAAIAGNFTNSCMKITEIKVIPESKNVLTVLPIAELGDMGNCHVGSYPFKRTVNLPAVADGRYLLHVRSVSGQAVNTLFNVSK